MSPAKTEKRQQFVWESIELKEKALERAKAEGRSLSNYINWLVTKDTKHLK